MARRILNRKDLRADFDAAERRKTEEDVETEDEAEEEDEDEEAEAGDEEGDEEGGEEEEEGAAPAKKKKPAKPVKPAKAKAPAKPKSRSRAAKVVRVRVVWGVFNNSHQQVASFEYPKKAEADAKAAQLTADKKQTHFVQPVKEAMEEK